MSDLGKGLGSGRDTCGQTRGGLVGGAPRPFTEEKEPYWEGPFNLFEKVGLGNVGKHAVGKKRKSVKAY